MVTSEQGLALIKHFEGCRLEAYQDVVGVWTIGYGWTQSVDGVVIHAGMQIDQLTADRLLLSGIGEYESGVGGLVSVPVSQSQFDALVSFVYNLGCRSLADSTLLKKLNQQDYAGAAMEFPRWNKAGGVVLAGLTSRRLAEQKLFLS
ncbi:lysozyme [Pluralibacter sp.]|jgi:GH24 family phage-related lysozyme (muramidase)|uniref:lysozyme n=1 Tax=Pluralibacter sp. TaxID=1920032 RepID=UPI0025D11A67|nr:lysozyme [Pluralibacter sp.]MBV8042110.1 lysozyme [Pluralibacter sp.]